MVVFEVSFALCECVRGKDKEREEGGQSGRATHCAKTRLYKTTFVFGPVVVVYIFIGCYNFTESYHTYGIHYLSNVQNAFVTL